MRCFNCDNKDELKESRISERYVAGGLPHVFLKGVIRAECSKCGEVYYNYGDLQQLHDTIAKVIITKDGILSGDEVRFLRTHLGYSTDMFAKITGYNRSHISRIENAKPGSRYKCPKLLDTFLRTSVLTKEPDRNYSAHDFLLDEHRNHYKTIELKRKQDNPWETNLDLSFV